MNKGSIFIGYVVFMLAIVSGSYLIAKGMVSSVSIVKMQREDVRLDLLCYSAIEKAKSILIEGKDVDYAFLVEESSSFAEKIDELEKANVYREKVDSAFMQIGFVKGNAFYVLGEMLEGKYKKRRLMKCFYVKAPVRIIKTEYN
jgi:tRNA pseudouridine-54 N-methylase